MTLLKTENEYNLALERIDKLILETEQLAIAVEDYEKVYCKIDLPHPIEAIKFRMEQQGLNQVDMEKYFGNRSHTSEILNKRRRLTLPMIRGLNECLGIPLDVLIQEYDLNTEKTKRGRPRIYSEEERKEKTKKYQEKYFKENREKILKKRNRER